MEGPYSLINVIVAHDGPIRCVSLGPSPYEIITGSQGDAPNLRRWKYSHDYLSIEEIGSPIYHDHWVTSVTSRSVEHQLLRFPEGCIVSGCMDAKIRVFGADGVLSFELLGHAKGVISFSWMYNKTSHLLSGSWDGTAILWDLDSAQVLHKFSGHENGVHVLSLSSGTIATTSTGESVDGKPANFQLRFWDPVSGQQIGQSLRDHTGSIRSITSLPGMGGFITSSNDGSVIVRSIDGQPIEAVLHNPSEDGMLPFILDCCSLHTTGGFDFASCGEDGSVMVWSGADRVQSIPHPNCVWTVLGIPSDEGAFLTGGHDGYLRLFSRDLSKLSNPSVAQITANFLSEVAEAVQKKKTGPSAEEIAKAPKWEARSQHPGRKENDVMVFNNEGSLIAAQWNSGSWVIIGEVTGSGDGGYIGSNYYDHILPVEIDTSQGPQSLKLGYNNAENPFVAAQRFIDANGLQQYYLQQIADWITQRAGNNNTPTLGSPAGVQNRSSNGVGPGSYASTSLPPQAPFSSPAAVEKYSFQVDGYVQFDELPNQSKLMNKLREINAQISGPSQLSEESLQAIDNAMRTLCETSRYHASQLRVDELTAILQMSQWPTQQQFILFDILRLVSIHPQGIETFLDHPLFTNFYNTLRSLLSDASQSSAAGIEFNSTFLTLAKFLANFMKFESARRRLSRLPPNARGASAIDDIVFSALNLLKHSNKLVRQGAISSVCNYLAALFKFRSPGNSLVPSERTNELLLAALMDAARVEIESEPVLLRILQGIQTLCAILPIVPRPVGYSISLATIKKNWQGKAKEQTANAIQELIINEA